MKIQLKRSNVLESGAAKKPTPAQMEYGELAVNYNANDPSIFLEDHLGNIVKVGGDLSLYQKIDSVGTAVFVCSPGEINVQSPLADRVEGTLWWNTEEGILYVWYEDADSSQWVIAVPQSIPDALTVEEADGLYLSKTTDDTAAGEITFEKLSTHEAGVSVTGGNVEVGTGATNANFISVSSTNIQNSSNYDATLGEYLINMGLGNNNIKAYRTISPTATGGGVGSTFCSYAQLRLTNGGIDNNNSFQRIAATHSSIRIDSSFNNSATNAEQEVTSFWASGYSDYNQWNASADRESKTAGFVYWNAIENPGTGSGYVSKDAVGFACRDIGRNHHNLTGFLSEVDTATNAQNYNFYAAGDAPNYFRGLTTHASGINLTGSANEISSISRESSGTDATLSIKGNKDDDNVVSIYSESAHDGNYIFDVFRKATGIGNEEAVIRAINTTTGITNGINIQSILTEPNAIQSGEKFTHYAAVNFYNHDAANIRVDGYWSGLSKSHAPNGEVFASFYEGDAPSYFGGLTEHVGGVKVTGGNPQEVITGMSGSPDGGLAIFNDGLEKSNITLSNDGEDLGIAVTSRSTGINNQGFTGLTIQVRQPEATGTIENSRILDIRPNETLTLSPNKQLDFINITAGETHNVSKFIGVRVQDNFARGTSNNYGFHSEINTDGDKNYNFYASGNAPNYFAGNITCGNQIRVGASSQVHQFLSVYEVNNKGEHNGYFANANTTTTANGLVTGFSADESLGSIGAPEAYGFRSRLTTSSPNNYNFYAEGNAPNYFAGGLYVAGDTESVAAVSIKPADESIFKKGLTAANYFGLHPGSALTFGARNKNIAGSGGMVVYGEGSVPIPAGQVQLNSNGLIVANGSPIATTFLVDSTETESDIINASNVIKLLQPKILSGGSNARFGFNLPSVIANASEAVQTYTHVLTEPDDENPVTEERTAVDQTKLIPLLTKALQEALTRIEQLESNTLQPLYSTLADLPDASEHHGKTAHVHSEGALYFAHAGSWVKLQNA